MKILVSTAGEAAAQEIADYVIEIAQKLDADLRALHILFPGESEAEGLRACEIFRELGEQNDVEVETMIAEGELVQTIIDCAEASNATPVSYTHLTLPTKRIV